jgi:hypothetical protein
VRVCLGRLTGGGRLSAVDVADDDHVDVHLLFTIAPLSAMFIVRVRNRLSIDRGRRRQTERTP